MYSLYGWIVRQLYVIFLFSGFRLPADPERLQKWALSLHSYLLIIHFMQQSRASVIWTKKKKCLYRNSKVSEKKENFSARSCKGETHV